MFTNFLIDATEATVKGIITGFIVIMVIALIVMIAAVVTIIIERKRE